MKSIDLTFEPISHTYKVNGRAVPSVTKVIESIFPEAYGPMSDEQREYVMKRGSAMHHGCRLLDQNDLDWGTVAPEIVERISAWKAFRENMPTWQMQLCETALGSESYQYAGTIDRLFSVAGKFALCDIKSTYVPCSRIQLGGYARLLRENGYSTIDQAVIVQVNDDGSYRTEWLDKHELGRMENMFLSCLNLYGFKSKFNLLKGQS